MLEGLLPQEKKVRRMPLIIESNKKLRCLNCGKKDDVIRKYGWIFCEDCYRLNSLMTPKAIIDVDSIYDKHKDHVKPCCEAKKFLENQN